MNINNNVQVLNNSKGIVSTKQNNSIKLNNNNAKVARDSFIKTSSPAFGSNFQTQVNLLSETFFRDEASIERGFAKAFNAIKEDTTIEKSGLFKNINNIYEKKGFKGLLRTLWQGDKDPEVDKILAKCPIGASISFAHGPEGGFGIRNNGPLGFINILTDNPNAPKDIELSFWALNSSRTFNDVAFSLEKDSSLALKQHNKNMNVYSSYYSDTESIRKHVEEREYDSYTTYYKKNGKINTFKTWLLGGKINMDQMPIR